MTLRRTQRRVQGKKVNYYVDTDTGVEYLSKPKSSRKVRSDRIGDSKLSIKDNRRLAMRRVGHKRHHAKKHRVPSWYGEWDDLVLVEAFELSKLREIDTGIKWDVDHMIPLQAQEASGLHCAENIQVIPARMNRQKNSRMELTQRLEWLTN